MILYTNTPISSSSFHERLERPTHLNIYLQGYSPLALFQDKVFRLMAELELQYKCAGHAALYTSCILIRLNLTFLKSDSSSTAWYVISQPNSDLYHHKFSADPDFYSFVAFL